MLSSKRKRSEEEKKSTLEVESHKKHKGDDSRIVTFYHATAKANLASIMQKGLLISERGENVYGLDFDVDYNEIYGSKENAKANLKPPCIHLARDYTTADSYRSLIEETIQVKAIILRIVIDTFVHKLEPDTEDRRANICMTNISSTCIAVCRNKAWPKLFDSSKSKTIDDAPSTATENALNKYSLNL